MAEERCNRQVICPTSGADQVEAVLRYETIKPNGCWTVANVAGVVVKEVCMGVDDCRLKIEEDNPDVHRPLPEEEVWGVPPRD